MAELKIKADSGGGTVSFKGPATTTSNAAVQLTLPVDDGTANQYLQTNGSGVLAWSTVSTDPTTTSGTNNFTVADGDLVIGTAGHGIDFSANSAGTGSSNVSELLTHYEKGTWSPTMPNSSNTVTVSHAEYVRIGRLVNTYCTIQNTPDNDGDSIQIGNLPYSNANASWHGHGSIFWSHTHDTTNLRPGVNGSVIYFHNTSTGGHVTGNSNTGWTRYLIGMTYFAD